MKQEAVEFEANHSDPLLRRPPAVKDAQRRNGINGGDPPKAGRRPFMVRQEKSGRSS